MLEVFVKSYAFLAKGGPVMFIIAACSVVALALVIERFLVLARKNILPPAFFSQLQSLIREKKQIDVLALCRASESPLARILLSGFESNVNLGRQDVEAAMETQGKVEIAQLEKRVAYLGTLASIGPLLGLLGTVTGMIQTFSVIRVIGVGNPLELSGGIAEALLNTAGGLFVGIPAFVFYRFFMQKIDDYALLMERVSREAMKYLWENHELPKNPS